MLININDIKNGMTVINDGKLCSIVEFQHVKPGKGSPFVKIKFKNLRTGAIVVDTFNTNVKIEKAHVNKSKSQFLYSAGDVYTFMNNETYEQTELNADQLGDSIKYLKEGLDIQINSFDGEVIGIELPEKIEYLIESAEEAVKGNTSTGATKDATMENGLIVKVPLFIKAGETILVSTIDGSYCGRA
jgi:elongation factor P